MTVSRFSLALPALVALAACEIGGEPEPAIDDGFRCVDTPTVIASLDEASALGFAAADILAMASGEHVTPIHWRSKYQDGDIDLDIGPESGEGTLTLSLAHDGGEIRFIQSEPEDGGFEDGAPAGCADRLEIDVTASLTTDGGALAETLPVTLRAETDLYASFTTELDLAAIAGSFAVTSNTPDVDVGTANLEVGVSSFGVSGALTGQVEMEGDGWVAVGFVEYATFPSAEPRCSIGEASIPFDAAFAGFAAADAMALLNKSWIFGLSWGGAEDVALEMDTEHDGGEVCAVISGGEGSAGSLRFGGTVTLATGDGTVNASFPVRITAEPGDDGTLGQVHMWNDAPYGELVPVAEFPAAYGEFGIDLSGYELGGVEFSGAFAPYDDPGSADGSLSILGGTAPDCSDEPGSGCPGYDIVEVARAEWGNTGVAP